MKPRYEVFKSAFDERWKDEAMAKKKKKEILKALKTLKKRAKMSPRCRPS